MSANDEKRAAVISLLNDASFRKWSNRRIAQACGVSHVFVGKIRLMLLGNVSDSPRYMRGSSEQTMRISKKARRETGKPVLFDSEKELEDSIVKAIRRDGRTAHRQVRCVVGRIDILTEDAVIEVKHALTCRGVFEAIGQVLMYREAVGGQRQALIYYTSREPEGQIDMLADFARNLGVEMIPWN